MSKEDELFKCLINCEVTLPPGWEPSAFRLPTCDDAWLDINGKISSGMSSCPMLIIRRKRWKPKNGDKVWVICASGPPQQYTFSAISMRRFYECGLVYRTEEEAHKASQAMENVLEQMYKDFHYAWQEVLE